MSRSHEPVTLKANRGLWYRGIYPNITAPEGFVHQLSNMEPDLTDLMVTRRDFASAVSTSAVVIRFYRFARSTGAARYIWLDASGNLYDTGSATPSTPIVAAATAGWGTPTDFVMTCIADRAYVSPVDRATGLTSAYVWVYNPDWAGVPMRQAAGTRPNTAGMAGATAAGGNCEPGLHLVALAYETTSGFITKIGATVLQFTCNSTNRTINLTSVPTGTANVVTKRHVLMTKVIPNFDGNVLNYEFFFVGTINDNVTTTYSINKFDSELVRSMDYLEDLLEQIPAGIGLTEYANSLCVAGEKANPGIIRVSVKLQYEAMAETDGYVDTGLSDGRGVRTIVDDGQNLRFFKSGRAGYTFDNGGAPITWQVRITDGDQGCEFLGIGRMFESGNIDAGQFLVGNTKGLYLFDGTLNQIPLSFNIETLWQQSSGSGVIQICVDSVQRRIYCLVNTSLFVADYTLGLSPDSIVWLTWTGGTLKAIQAASGGLLISNSNYSGISSLSSSRTGQDHWGTNYTQLLQFPAIPRLGGGITYHFSEWRLTAHYSAGSGNFTVDFIGEGRIVQSQAAQTIPANTWAAGGTFGSLISSQAEGLEFKLISDNGNSQTLYFDSVQLYLRTTQLSKAQ